MGCVAEKNYQTLLLGMRHVMLCFEFSVHVYHFICNGLCCFATAEIGAKSTGQKKTNYGSGKETLRLRPNGQAKVEKVSGSF